MNHRDLGSPRYAGETAATGAGDMALVGFFLVSCSLAPVGTWREGDVAAWIVGNLVVPGVQGTWRPQMQLLVLLGFFFGALRVFFFFF